MKSFFLKQIAEEKAKNQSASFQLTTENTKHLPALLQNYLKICNWYHQPLTHIAELLYDEMHLKLNAKGDWKKLKGLQYNFSKEPARVVWMHTNMMGFIPFEGIDKFRNGRGNMFMKLMKVFTLGDATGHEMDISALVTILAETPFIPSYLIQDYIHFENLDNNSIRATLEWNRLKVSGVFHFNVEGEITHFITEKRYKSAKKGYDLVPWRIDVSAYQSVNGIRIPKNLSATWLMKEGDFTYFKATLANVKFEN